MDVAAPASTTRGDADLSAVGALVADPARCRILLALDDGRALPASRLAAEAGVSAATASSHLAKLTNTGLLTVEIHGRYRYYRLAGPAVGRLIETLGELAPAAPIRSLREGSRAHALRLARTCYDHLAGRLGVAIMGTFLDRGYVSGGDGVHRPDDSDPRAGAGRDVEYTLTPCGQDFLADFGVSMPSRRPTVRYCVDWTEQQHHLAGALGRGVRDRFVELGWIRRATASRAVHITDPGAIGLREALGIDQSAL
jgi:DNA-binding transcriptional ArsR family regulator